MWSVSVISRLYADSELFLKKPSGNFSFYLKLKNVSLIGHQCPISND